MNTSVRELQTTPVPDTVDAPGWGFLPAGGVDWPGLLAQLGQRLLPWLVPVALIAGWCM